MIPAKKKNLNQVVLKQGANHLDFQHEFEPTNINAWGADVNASDKQVNNPPAMPSDSTSELIKRFAETVKEFSHLCKSHLLRKVGNTQDPVIVPPLAQKFFDVNALHHNAQQQCNAKVRGELSACIDVKSS